MNWSVTQVHVHTFPTSLTRVFSLHKICSNRVMRNSDWNGHAIRLTLLINRYKCICLKSRTKCFHNRTVLDIRTVVLFVFFPFGSYSRFWHFDWMMISMADDASISREANTIDAPGISFCLVRAISLFYVCYLDLFFLSFEHR